MADYNLRTLKVCQAGMNKLVKEGEKLKEELTRLNLKVQNRRKVTHLKYRVRKKDLEPIKKHVELIMDMAFNLRNYAGKNLPKDEREIPVFWGDCYLEDSRKILIILDSLDILTGKEAVEAVELTSIIAEGFKK